MVYRRIIPHQSDFPKNQIFTQSEKMNAPSQKHHFPHSYMYITPLNEDFFREKTSKTGAFWLLLDARRFNLSVVVC